MHIKFKYLFYFITICLSFVFSQSYEDLQKMQTEYKELLERESLQKPKDVIDAEKSIQSIDLPDKIIYTRKDIESLLVNTEKLLMQLKSINDSTDFMPFVGYEIFTQRDTIPFWQNLPIPKNYILGPGDEVTISLWGETESYTSKKINRDGQVFIDNIGIIDIGGKSVMDAKKYVLSKYSRLYSTLLGKTPTSFIDITLGELKSVNVHFVGFVNIPGVHMVHPFSSVITGLTQAGGITEKGSLRDIQIIRNGKKIATIDIYNYIFRGKDVGDIRLLDQDIIFVSPRASTIAITGSILKPGYYESLKNESLNDLINIAGGKTSKSSEQIFVFNDNGYVLEPNQLVNFIPTDGDSIHIPFKPEINSFVRIEGQIKNSGFYPFELGMTLNDLIEATMTKSDPDFIKTLDLSKIIITRRNPAGSDPEKIIVNLYIQNIDLHNGDHINISLIRKNQLIESVKITGEVNIPGAYPVNNLTSLSSILEMAGGYTANALTDGIEIFRDSVKIAWDKDTFFLQDGDSLNFLKKSGLIFITGEVNVPGYLTFKKGDSIKKYIKRAGGFTSFANKSNVLVVYPNGNAQPKSWSSSPKILEGATIIVNEKSFIKSTADQSGWDIFSRTTTEISNIATTFLTLIIIMNQNQ